MGKTDLVEQYRPKFKILRDPYWAPSPIPATSDASGQLLNRGIQMPIIRTHLVYFRTLVTGWLL